MDYGLGGGDDDEENEYADLEETETEEHTTKDAIIFAIDARRPMLEPGPDGGASPLAQALGCVQASMKRRVQAGDSDFLAILLFGTDKSKALTATIWLCSMDDFAEMNAVWDAWATGGNAPCRACVESPRLASPDFTVEIGLIAAR